MVKCIINSLWNPNFLLVLTGWLEIHMTTTVPFLCLFLWSVNLGDAFLLLCPQGRVTITRPSVLLWQPNEWFSILVCSFFFSQWSRRYFEPVSVFILIEHMYILTPTTLCRYPHSLPPDCSESLPTGLPVVLSLNSALHFPSLLQNLQWFTIYDF